MELLKKKITYKDQNGNEHSRYAFYLKVEGLTKLIEVKPVTYGEKGNNYKMLDIVSKYVKQ